MMIRPRLTRSSALLAVAALLCSAAAVHAEGVMIKPKHKAGETTYVEQETQAQQKINNPAMGGEMEINVHRIYGLMRKVDSASADGAHISWTFDRAMQKFDSPMMEGAFDSDSPGAEDESDQLAVPLKAMIGGKFNVEIDKDNVVKSFSGMNAIQDKVQEAAPGNMLVAQLSRDLSDDRGRVTYGEAPYLMYPNKEVNVGDKWVKTQRDTIPQIGKVISHYEYALDKITEDGGRKVAIINFTSTLERDTSGKDAGDAHGMNAEVKGSRKGTITYDIERGMVLKSVSTDETTIEMKPPAKKSGDDDDDDDRGPPPGMKIQVKAKNNITVMSEADRAKQKAEAAKHVPAKKDEKKADSKKNDAKKPAKKDKDEDEDE